MAQSLYTRALDHFISFLAVKDRIMDTLVGSLRGVGYSILPMLVSLTGVCVIRVIWIFTVFKSVHTTFSLYISYPITWVITLVAHGICFMVVRKRIRRVA